MSSIRHSPESSSISRSKSTIQLPYRLKNVSLDALSHSSREGIARNLNVEFRSSNDTSQRISNFIGAAELVGFGWQEIEKIKHQDSPTEELLKEWCSRDDLEEPTIGNLWDILVQLNRTDVLENGKDTIIQDAQNFLKARRRQRLRHLPLQSRDVGSTSDGAMDQDVDESKMLSRADVIHGKPQTFDCFVCFNYNKFDHDFVKEMSCKLENKPYSLVMFIPGRDDLPGGSRYTMDAQLIKHRCRRLVVIVSRNFHNSAACDFHVKFCHALSPGARSKKMVPVLIEPDVLVPDILNHVGLCDYTKEDMRDWFWDRLSNAIKAPLHPEEC